MCRLMALPNDYSDIVTVPIEYGRYVSDAEFKARIAGYCNWLLQMLKIYLATPRMRSAKK